MGALTRTQVTSCAIALTCMAFGASAEPLATHDAGEAANAILINNVVIFDGVGDGLRPGNRLIVGRAIKQISAEAITPPQHSQVINGGGRVLMPGLTDSHWHMTMAANVPQNLQKPDLGLMYANTVAEARRTLLRGFTTVRDTGGPTFGIKEAIDTGVIPGPRVYPSGAMISQTAGHGDFSPAYRQPKVLGGPVSRLEEIGQFTMADGVPQMLGAVRRELK